jgi:hypothetical protein
LSGTPARVRCFSVEIEGKPVVFQKKEYVVFQKMEMYDGFQKKELQDKKEFQLSKWDRENTRAMTVKRPPTTEGRFSSKSQAANLGQLLSVIGRLLAVIASVIGGPLTVNVSNSQLIAKISSYTLSHQLLVLI